MPYHPKRRPLTYLTRSICLLESNGYLVDIVERRVGRRCTKDLFGFIDLIAISPKNEMIGIQVTSGGCLTKHVEKSSEKEVAHKMKRWISTGAKLHALIWRKRKVGRVCEIWEIDKDMDWEKISEAEVIGQGIQ